MALIPALCLILDLYLLRLANIVEWPHLSIHQVNSQRYIDDHSMVYYEVYKASE